MSETAKGVCALIGSCLIWGLSPIFYKQLMDVPPLVVMSHRVLWSLALFVLFLTLQRRLSEVAPLFATRRRVVILCLAAFMVACNWSMFIWAVFVGQTTQSAMGYYIYPLLAVALGRFVMGDVLGRAQVAAVGLAGVGVGLVTLGLGNVPWIGLILAVTFALYGLIKKQGVAGPVVSVTGEALLVAPLAVLALLYYGNSDVAVFGTDPVESVLLVLSGPVTGVPLVLFAYGARRLTVSSTGVLLYLNPTLQFCVAVFVFSEAFTPLHLIGFVLIWGALGLYSGQAFIRAKASRAAAASGTMVK